jgi:hypothetical protein
MAEKIKNPLLLYKKNESYLETHQTKQHYKALLHKELHESSFFLRKIFQIPHFFLDSPFPKW